MLARECTGIILRTVCAAAAAAAIASCGGGGSNSAVPPVRPVSTSTPQPTATPAGPFVTQWNSGSAYAPVSITISFPYAPSPGHVVLAALWNNGQNTGAPDTYQPPPGWILADQSAGYYETYQLFWHVVGTSDTNSYVFTPLAPQRQHAWIAADAAHVSGLDRSASVFVNNTTAFTTPSVTPSYSGDLAIALNLPIATGTLAWTNPAAWTVGIGPTSPWSGEGLSEMLPSGGSVSESSTLSAVATGYSALALLSPSGAKPLPTPASSPPPVDWATFGYDIQRTGYNPNETTIGIGSFSTMHPMSFGLPNVGNDIQGEPVLAMNVDVSGTARNLLYEGGASGILYALDADTGSTVWSKQLGTSTYNCFSSAPAPWGIGGTPVIDRSHNRIYVPDGQNQVHALDLATGAEAPGWPVSVAPPPGQDFIHAGLTYNADNGMLYVGTGSRCDFGPWYGRIAAVSTATASVAGTFYPDQGSSGGSVWGFGGASVDPVTNNVFIATGNTDAEAPQNAFYSERIIELAPNLSTVIAANYPSLPQSPDADFGATPMLFQPPGCPPLLAAVNKSGVFVLYDRSNIAAGPTQSILMSITTSYGDFIGVPAYDPVTNYVYVGLPSSQGIYKPGLAAFSMTSNCTLNPTPVWNAAFGPDGATIPDDTQRSPITVANGVVYISGFTDDTTYAFNAATGAQLWSASLGGVGIIGPIVASGRLYVGNRSGTIRAWQP